jgi:hypothetical protein
MYVISLLWSALSERITLLRRLSELISLLRPGSLSISKAYVRLADLITEPEAVLI